MVNALKRKYESFGALKVKNLLSPQEVAFYLSEVRRLSGYSDSDVAAVIQGQKPPYVSPGAVTRTPTLWPLVVHPRLVAIARATLGEEVKFLGGDVVFAHRSGTGFHRDTAYDIEVGPRWDPGFAGFKMMRVMLFFHESLSARLHVVPGSHLTTASSLQADDMVIENPGHSQACIEAQPGDAVLFDSRILHGGEEVTQPRYGMILTYAVQNRFSITTHFHSHLVRVDNSLSDPSPPFRDLLRRHGLFFEASLDTGLRSHFEQMWKQVRKGTNHDFSLNDS